MELGHTIKFKAIYLNPTLMICKTENEASLQQLPDEQQISRKR